MASSLSRDSNCFRLEWHGLPYTCECAWSELKLAPPRPACALAGRPVPRTPQAMLRRTAWAILTMWQPTRVGVRVCARCLLYTSPSPRD
eukprot:15126790-Alexandrium_andersonii.AAC.1